MKEHIKLALLGTGCTKEYADKQTQYILNGIKEKIDKYFEDLYGRTDMRMFADEIPKELKEKFT